MSSQSIVKSQLLLSMKSEPYNLARRAICGVVSVLAAEELKNNRWKEIISHMSNVILSVLIDL